MSEGGVISRWEIAPPLEGTTEQIRLPVELSTRRYLDGRDEVQLLAPSLTAEGYRQRRRQPTPDPYGPASKRLLELGGRLRYLRR